MLPRVALGQHCCAQSTNLDNYRSLVGGDLIDEIQDLAKALRGVRVCHINATASGGGVAELLTKQVPLYQALGIECHWRLIHGDQEFFTITKGFHNALQGAKYDIEPSTVEKYLKQNQDAAESLDEHYDVYIVHDPQPAAIRHFAKVNADRWIWRCHIDSSQPSAAVWDFIRPYLESFDAIVFTMEAFRPPGLQHPRVVYIPPAIDPLSTKNMELSYDLSRRVMANAGVNLYEPILLQVSRFDPWKDPLGVIQAYQMVKQQRPGVQLVLIGAMAADDPEGWQILNTINQEARTDADLFVFTNLMGVGNMEVNAFQRGSDIVIQKSLREGFGLVVSEALWKEKPIVAGSAGGIPMQFPNGFEDYLINSVEACAEKLEYLFEHPKAAREFGHAGREHVRQNFLMPRLMRDELTLIREVLATKS